MFNIEPIKLLMGTHSDTGTTGSGCFMNVIAYLNGEAQITDQSTCVCATIRPIAIWLNDYMDDIERQTLIPFIHRAIGSATTDPDLLMKRARLAVVFAESAAKSAARYAESAKSAARYAAKSAARYAESAKSAAESAKSAAESAARHAAESAARHAESAARYAESAARHAESAESAEYVLARKGLIEAGLHFLDEACPLADVPTQILIERANRLVELAKA